MKINPPPYIVVEGNIGAGKTSLCKRLAEKWQGRLVLETFEDNPYLADFYKDKRYALATELTFMSARHRQLDALLAIPHPHHPPQPLVADYIFSKTLLFAGQNLSGRDFDLFKKLFEVHNQSFPKPSLLVYLYRPVNELLNNIRHRNRSYEQSISADYLQKIEQGYEAFIQTQKTEIPILYLDLSQADFIDNPAHYERILELIHSNPKPGIHKHRIQQMAVGS
jgi:deoxyguanosine kinase